MSSEEGTNSSIQEKPVTENLVFKIPGVNLSYLNQRIEKLNKIAKKLSLEPLSTKVHKIETIQTEKNGIFKKVYHIEIIGSSLKIPGWSFLGTLEHGEAGNLLRLLPGIDVSTSYRTAKPICDHCNKRRSRKNTYLVKSDKGDVKQVGHSCVRDFLGHVDPKQLAFMATLIKELEECSEEREGRFGGGQIYLENFVFMAAEVTIQIGFVSASAANKYAEKSLGVGLETTSSRVIRELFPVKGYTPMTISNAAVELGYHAIEWAKSLIGSGVTSDYEHNLAMVASKDVITHKDFGLAASLVAAYRKNVLKIENDRVAKKNQTESSYFGTVGVSEDFILTLKKQIVTEGFSWRQEFSYIYIFEDQSQNIGVWFSSKRIEMDGGKTYLIKGSVKARSLYKDKKQTSLTRCKVIHCLVPSTQSNESSHDA
jgi:hypothetical protein